MTHVRKAPTTSSSTEEVNLPRGEELSAGAVTKKSAAAKAQSPPGWNPSSSEDTAIVAIDCEMVGVGPDGKSHSLARVVIVNYYGGVLLDEFVSQLEPVVDYRTNVSGIRPEHLKGASSFKDVQKQVFRIIKDKIVVGHQLMSDFKVLMLDHPKLYIRDTARYTPLLKAPGKPHSLKQLASEILEMQIQEEHHDPAEDARIALLVYRHVQKNWEASIKTHVKTPSSINPITKLVEKANRAALKVPKTGHSSSSSTAPSSSTAMATPKTKKDEDADSWASSSEDSESDDSTSNNSDSDDSSDASD